MTPPIYGKVLYAPVLRKFNYSTHIGTSEGVKEIFFPEEFREKFLENKFYIITNSFSTDQNVHTLKHKISQIFETQKFSIDEEKVSDFINPKVVSVADVILSAGSKRVSLEGYLFDVQDTVNVGGKKRRFMKFSENEEHEPAVTVKLWDDQCDLPCRTDVKVKIENIMVKKFKDVNDVNSTPLTKIDVCEVAYDGRIEIVGIDWDRPLCSVICKDMTIKKVREEIITQCYGKYGILPKGESFAVQILGEDIIKMTKVTERVGIVKGEKNKKE